MCGRFVLVTPAEALARDFAAIDPGLDLVPRYNIGPGQDVVVVRVEDGVRRLATLRWGLVPSWAKDASIASKLSNARSETAAAKPSFREAMRRRRALVPASGFYEWKREGRRRQPWYFAPASTSTLAIAALHEAWRAVDGRVVETVCLLTTSANGLMAPIHDRMPVLIGREDVERWLDPAIVDPHALQDLFVPAADAVLRCHPVSTAVGSVVVDRQSNIEEIDVEADVAQPRLPF